MAQTKKQAMPAGEGVWLIGGIALILVLLLIILVRLFMTERPTVAPFGRVTDLTPSQADTLLGLEAAASGGMKTSAPPLTAAQEVTLRSLEAGVGIRRN